MNLLGGVFTNAKRLYLICQIGWICFKLGLHNLGLWLRGHAKFCNDMIKVCVVCYTVCINVNF